MAAIKHPELREWLLLKIRIYYHERSKQVDAQKATAGGSPCRDNAPVGDSAGGDDDIPY